MEKSQSPTWGIFFLPSPGGRYLQCAHWRGMRGTPKGLRFFRRKRSDVDSLPLIRHGSAVPPSPRGRLFSHLANSDTICYNTPGASDMRWRCQYAVGGGPSLGRRPHFSFLLHYIGGGWCHGDLFRPVSVRHSDRRHHFSGSPDKKEVTALA